MLKKLLIAVAGLSWAVSALEIAEVFQDNMVLQRERPVAVWGKGRAGEKISVEFKGNTVSCTVGKDGRWLVELPPMPASKEGATLTIQGDRKRWFENVLVGDVWLCAGQSNMDWYIDGITEAKKYLVQINQPEIRVLKICHQFTQMPQNSFVSPGWAVSTLNNARQFSAVGYIVGSTLHKALNVPIGLISVAVGGGRIEAFCSPESFRKAGVSAQVRTAFEKSVRSFTGKKPEELAREKQRYPLAIYNGMIAPILPYTIRGVLWYQGEENYRDGISYEEKLRAFAWTLRSGFRNPKLPIYLVMLPPWEYNNDSLDDKMPQVLMAQQNFVNKDKYSELISTTDCGDAKSVHPMSKEPLALRLANLVLYKEYGRGDATVMTPTVLNVKRESNKTLLVTFHNANVLKTRDGKSINWLETAGRDGKFQAATGVTCGENNDMLRVTAAQPEPMTLRFGFDCLATPNLVNQAGIPVAPFEKQIK